MLKEKPNFYAILKADVRYDKRLSSTAKIIHAEITALTNKNGFCWAANKYFADNFDISERQVSKIIAQLEELNHISTEVLENNKRKIRVEQKFQGDRTKVHTPPRTKVLYNNTSNNNINNNTSCEVELLKIINQVIGREFRTLPRGFKKTLDLFSLEEIKKSLTNMSADAWHSERLKTLKLDYLLRATTIDKFLSEEGVQQKEVEYGRRLNLDTGKYERYEL